MLRDADNIRGPDMAASCLSPVLALADMQSSSMNKRPDTTTTSNTKNSPLTPRGLRIPDAAAYMGFTPWYVEEIVRSGELPALKLCAHYTILREDADAFLDRKREELEKRRGSRT